MEAADAGRGEPGRAEARLQWLEMGLERLQDELRQLRSRLTGLEQDLAIAQAVQDDQLGRLRRRLLELQVVVNGDCSVP